MRKMIFVCFAMILMVSRVSFAEMTVDQSGNVGIGKPSPQAKLDVDGTIRAEKLCDENGSNCADLNIGLKRKILFSQHIRADSASACQGCCESSRYKSFDVTVIVKENCSVSDTNPSYCYLVVENFATNSYSDTGSYEWRLIYYPVVITGAQRKPC